MDGYVSKPVRKRELYEAMHPFFTELDKEVADAVPEETPQATNVNWEAALQAMGGKHELMLEISQVAVDELSQLTDELKESLAAGDIERLQRAAHTVRGTVRIFKADHIGKLAGQIEDICKQNTVARP